MTHAGETQEPLRLYFHGPQGVGKRRCVEALASEADASLLIADLSRIVTTETDFGETIKLLFREAWFQDAMLFLEALDEIRGDERSRAFDCVLDAMAEHGGVTILAGAAHWYGSYRCPVDVITVPFGLPDFTSRHSEWQASLEARGVSPGEHTLNTLSDQFRLSPAQIADAVSMACGSAQWRTNAQPASESGPKSNINSSNNSEQCTILQLGFAAPTLDDLFAAARAQSGHELAALAHKIEPQIRLGRHRPARGLARPAARDLPARGASPPGAGRVGLRPQAVAAARASTRCSPGRPGTGKTMAAEVIADELGLDLYRIDLSGVVSKYIGETEKNLDRIFDGGRERQRHPLLRRGRRAVRQALRGAATRTTATPTSRSAYLLQKMEEYEGVAILATNLRQNLDDAFMRRLALHRRVPVPRRGEPRGASGQASGRPRRRWHDDVDLDFLAREFKLSGGNIKNIALAGAFLAAEDAGPVIDGAPAPGHPPRAPEDPGRLCRRPVWMRLNKNRGGS